MNRQQALERLRRINQRLSAGRVTRFFVPVLDAAGVWLRHGFRHVAVRTRIRLGLGSTAATSALRIDEPGRAGSLIFRCNLCGTPCVSLVSQLEREISSCVACASSVRYRTIIHALSVELFGKSLALPDFPERRDVKGLGMSDWEGYAAPLAAKFDYTNTFYHREPKLDITAIDRALEGMFDFIISTEVFEHVPPPVSRAFDNVYRLLKPGGVLIFSVPYRPTGTTVEHFPDLHSYQLTDSDGRLLLTNTTATGETQVFPDLVFHGGPGATLEMRTFSEQSLVEEFIRAGFSEPTIYKQPYFEYGVYSSLPWSFPMAVRKPAMESRVREP